MISTTYKNSGFVRIFSTCEKPCQPLYRISLDFRISSSKLFLALFPHSAKNLLFIDIIEQSCITVESLHNFSSLLFI